MSLSADQSVSPLAAGPITSRATASDPDDRTSIKHPSKNRCKSPDEVERQELLGYLISHQQFKLVDAAVSTLPLMIMPPPPRSLTEPSKAESIESISCGLSLNAHQSISPSAAGPITSGATASDLISHISPSEILNNVMDVKNVATDGSDGCSNLPDSSGDRLQDQPRIAKISTLQKIVNNSRRKKANCSRLSGCRLRHRCRSATTDH